ncbi:MAG: hypothetical protein GF401_15335 [Chitinivibrionales bacterium]|nr:hypothetical protein [Chitinivibrionales bacterium]
MPLIQPNQTCMIGSTPYKSGEDALDALERNPLSIPTWPQLPKRSFRENMVPQYCEGFPGVSYDDAEKKVWVERTDELLETMAGFYEKIVEKDLDYFALGDEHAAGFHAFVRRLKGNKVPYIKGQVIGAFTFGLTLNDNDGKAVWFDEQYQDIVLKGITAKALWQIKVLSEIGEKVAIFFDEPIFSALGTPAYMGISDEDVISGVNEITGEIHEAGGLVGIHCCGNMDWSLIARTDIDVIAFDAYEFGEKVALYPDAIGEFLDRGKILGWGIVPTGSSEDIEKENVDSLNKRIDQLTTVFTDKGIGKEKIESQRIFTPACGLGNLKEDEAEKVLSMLRKVGER